VGNRPAPQRLPDEFHDLIDRGRAFTPLAIELTDGTVAPRVLVATDGKIAGIDGRDRGPGGTPPPTDIREDEIVAVRPVGGLLGRRRWHRREIEPPARLRIRAWSHDPDDRFAHLRPVVRFEQLRGNKMLRDLDARETPVRAVFVSPLDMDGLRADYDLPSSLSLRGEVDAIVCRNTRAEIVGSRGVKR
jgi:hypothetical protein